MQIWWKRKDDEKEFTPPLFSCIEEESPPCLPVFVQLLSIVVTDGKSCRLCMSRRHERGWVVFNEFVVTRVTENEALHLDANWKLPCILYYVQLESDPQNGNSHIVVIRYC
uniref:Uncharacterized protein n=1 Tax=Parascaris equorum TaxID=6256 RepID=A0A914RWC2_PAREQ